MVASENKKFFNNDGSEYTFDFENFIKNELGLGKKTEKKKLDAKRSIEVCQDFLRGICTRTNCKYQHTAKKFVVCKHWLRGLCMKGEELCEYLHEYDISKMPKCIYYTLYGECNLPDCIYSHNEFDCERCIWYDRGFCIKGSKCLKKHVKQSVCQSYLAGFCPSGPNCLNGHPKMNLICKNRGFNKNIYNKMMTLIEEGGDSKIQKTLRVQNCMHFPHKKVTCFNCGVKGHIARNCPVKFLCKI